MNKENLRKKYLDLRLSHDKTEKARKDRAFLTTILNWNKFQDAKKVCIYKSYQSEVDTSEILKIDGKIFEIPKVISETEMITDSNDFDLVFMPGVVFDGYGYRVGFGKGYYDRFLKKVTGVKVGLCYEFQLIDKIENDDYDVPVDILITEKKIYEF